MLKNFTQIKSAEYFYKFNMLEYFNLLNIPLVLNFNSAQILSVTLILFGVIDILGTIPVIISLQKKHGTINSRKAAIISAFLMIIFLFMGDGILKLFGIDIGSFAIAGSIILFLLGLEMVLGMTFFHANEEEISSAHIMPLAFPMIAGAGSMTTILTLKSTYSTENILVGIILNIIFVYIVLKSCRWIEKKIGPNGANMLRKIFGIILLAIAIKIFKMGIGVS